MDMSLHECYMNITCRERKKGYAHGQWHNKRNNGRRPSARTEWNMK